MQISIIIPIYKVEKYIERCINSVIMQAFTDYEVILVDDFSPDNALAIGENLLQKNNIEFQAIKHQENKGLSEARNTGIKVAKGKYIMFMDSDDELAHNEVLTQFHEAIEREQADFVTANTRVVAENKNVKWIKELEKNKKINKDETILEAFLYTRIYMSAWNKLINKDFLLQHNLFFLKDITYEDELWVFQMCVVAKKVFCLPYYNYNYYKDIPTAITRSRGEIDCIDMIKVIKIQLETANEKQLINNKNANAFIFNFKRLSTKVLRPKTLKNKELWTRYYKELSQLYRQSELWQYKKLFRFPANIAYLIRKEQRKSRQNNGNRLYRKILKKL